MLPSRIQTFLRIRPNESQLVLYLFLFSLMTGATTIFSYTVAFSLFLSEFEETSFAYVFITAGILSLIVGALFTRLEQIISIKQLFQYTVALLLVSTILLQLGLWLGAGNWLYWILLVWYRLFYILTYFAFWGLTNRVLNVEQGKRLLGTIGLGEVIILFVGYATVPWFASTFGVSNLLIFHAITVLGSLVMVILLKPYIREEEIGSVEQLVESRDSDQGLIISSLVNTFFSLFSQTYIRYIFAISFLTVISYFVIDYGFYGVVRTQFTNATELANFIGYFWALVYGFGIFVRLLVTNNLLRRWGLFAGLIILPGSFGLVSLLLVVTTTLDPSAAIVLWLVSLIKLLEDGLIITINRTSSALLYQPLPQKTSLSTQIVAESLIAPIGLGFSGVLLLIFNNLPFFDLTWLSYAFLIIAALWIFAVRGAFQGYVGALNQALSQRRLQGTLSDLNDSASLEVLKGYLQSDDPRKVVYVLDLMEKVDPDWLSSKITEYVTHPNDYVARAAVKVVGRLNVIDALPAVEALSAKQSPVSPEALFTLLALDKSSAVERAMPYLEHPNVELTGQAILGLLTHQGDTNKAVAVDYLKKLVHSDIPERREKAAVIIGQLPGNAFTDLLDQLIQDDHNTVQKVALQALINIQSESSERLEKSVEQFENDPALFQQFLHSLRYSDTPQATNILFKYVTHSDPITRSNALDGLANKTFKATSRQEKNLVKEAIEQELVLATWATATLADLDGETEINPLREAINDLFEACKGRIFQLLGILYDREIVERVEIDYKSAKDKRHKALALEALLNHIDYKHQTDITPFLLYDDSQSIWQNLQAHRNQDRMKFIERLYALIVNATVQGQDISDWVRSTAIYAAGSRKETSFTETINRLQRAGNPLIKETAQWAAKEIQSA